MKLLQVKELKKRIISVSINLSKMVLCSYKNILSHAYTFVVFINVF